MEGHDQLKKRYRKLYKELEIIEIIRGMTRAEMKMILNYLLKPKNNEKKKQKKQV